MPVQRAAGLLAMVTLAVAASAAVLARAGAPPDLFDDLHRRGQQQNGELKTFTASFVETTTSALLTRPLVARGTVVVERPGRVALMYTDPDARTIIIDGDRMTMSWPSRQLRQTKDVGASQRRVQKYFVDASPAELRRHFDVTARDASDRPGYLVTLVPKRKQIKEGVSRLELWIDPATLLLSAMRITFANGDAKMMTFSDVRPNAAVDPSVFSAR